MPIDITKPLDTQTLTALREKHKLAIESIMAEGTPKQEQIFRELNVDPQSIKEYYEDLVIKNEALKTRHVDAERTSALLGWLATAVTAIAFYTVPFLKYNPAEKEAGKLRLGHENKVVRGIVAGLTSISTGFATGFVATRVLGRTIRDEAISLVKTSREAFVNELAVALELKEQKMAAASVPASMAPETRASFADRVHTPEASFVNRVTAEDPAIAPSL